MKNGKRRVSRAIFALAFVVGIVAATVALTSEPAEAKPPVGPLCGPTILFECTFRDGSTELVGLTVCELKKFEKKNKATCEPYTGW